MYFDVAVVAIAAGDSREIETDAVDYAVVVVAGAVVAAAIVVDIGNS